MAAAEHALFRRDLMKGAKGLLISITAARPDPVRRRSGNRIREEVDQDANIIPPATFDERTQGVIRATVVATGIDKSAAEIAAAPIDPRPPKPASRPAPRGSSGAGPQAARPRAATGRRSHPLAEAMRSQPWLVHAEFPPAEQDLPGSASTADAAASGAAGSAAARNAAA